MTKIKITTIDTAKFKSIPLSKITPQNPQEGFDLMAENMHTLIQPPEELEGLTYREKCNAHGGNITDYMWTESVKKAFYEHPPHKWLIDIYKGKKGIQWSIWMLQYEPCNEEDVK